MKNGAQLRPIGVIRSVLKARTDAPKQGSEGAPDAWLEMSPAVAQGLDGLRVGDDIIVVTWLHRARRSVLKVYPRSNRRLPLTGVFATRSPDRPNPLGLHRVTIRKLSRNRLRASAIHSRERAGGSGGRGAAPPCSIRIGPIEALDGTPVVDIKPVLVERGDF